MPNNFPPGTFFGGGAMKSVAQLPAWLIEHFRGGGDTLSAYAESATTFRALEIRSNTVAGGALKLYAKDDAEIDDHPLLDLLHNVNAEWNASDLWRYTEAGRLVYGAGYWQKIRAGREPRELFYLNPGTMKPNLTKRGIASFTQTIKGDVTHFNRDDVVYFRGAYDPQSDLTGRANLRWLINAALGEGATEAWLNAFFRNGAVPAVIFSTDKPMSDPEMEKAKAWWERLFRGVANAFRTAFLGNGLKPYTVGSSIKEMELPGVRTELRRTISIVTGVPELLFSATASADLTPVELAMKVLYYTTIIPAWQWYAEVLNAELLTEFPDLVGGGAYLAFDTDDIEVLQEDATSKAARLKLLVDANIIKPEVAAKELGYDAADVPEPKPVPTQLQQPGPNGQPPATPANSAGAGQQPPAAQPAGQRAVAARDLERWQRKALNALERGKPAGVTFASDAIAASEHARITDALAEAKTADQVRAVFESEPEQDLLAAAVAELRRFNDLAAA